MSDLAAFAGGGVDVEASHVEVEPGVEIRTVRFSSPRTAGRVPLVFVAGWISPLNTWRHFLPEVAAHRPILYLESREKSSSRIAGPTGFGIPDMVRDLHRVLADRGYGGRDYVLAGSSMGATTILEALPELERAPLAAALILPNARFDLPGCTRLLRFVPPRCCRP